MSDLADRVLAAIEETERVAKESVGESRFLPRGSSWAARPLATAPCHHGWSYRVAGAYDSSVVDEADQTVAAHIARHDPAAVLRRCAADREIVEAVERSYAGVIALRLLARGYGITEEES